MRWRADTTRRRIERTTRRHDKLRAHDRHEEMTSRHDEMTSRRDEMTSRHDEMTSLHDEMTSRRNKMTCRRDEMTSRSDETMRWTFCPRFDVIQDTGATLRTHSFGRKMSLFVLRVITLRTQVSRRDVYCPVAFFPAGRISYVLKINVRSLRSLLHTTTFRQSW